MINETQDYSAYLYDQVLLGRKETCGKELFETTVNNRKEYNPIDEERAIGVVKYAFEYYLGWSPEQTYENISDDILQKLKLNGLVYQRIKFPIELDPSDNLKYLVHRMYPEKYSYDSSKAIIEYYDKVLSGEIKRFKKGFFAQDDGKDRAAICFRHMLDLSGRFSSIKEIYDFFCTTDGRKMLSRYKLTSACRDLFEFPIDFLHYSLSAADREDRYYWQLRFEEINSKQKKNYKKRGIFVA